MKTVIVDRETIVTKEVTECSDMITIVVPSSAIIKHLFESYNCGRVYNTVIVLDNLRSETTLQLCVKERLLMHINVTTANITKEVYFYELGYASKQKPKHS